MRRFVAAVLVVLVVAGCGDDVAKGYSGINPKPATTAAP